VANSSGKSGILEVAEPVGHAEVAEVDDGGDIALAQVVESPGRQIPSRSASGAEPGPVQRRAVAQHLQAEFLDQVEVGAPVAVMAALFHFVHADPSALDGRVAVLDTGSKDESWRHEESTSMSTTSAAPAASQLDPSQRRLAAGLLVSLSLHGLLLALQFGIPGLRPGSGAPLTVSLAPAPAAVVAPEPVPAAPVPPLPVPASTAPTPPVPPVQPAPVPVPVPVPTPAARSGFRLVDPVKPAPVPAPVPAPAPAPAPAIAAKRPVRRRPRPRRDRLPDALHTRVIAQDSHQDNAFKVPLPDVEAAAPEAHQEEENAQERERLALEREREREERHAAEEAALRADTENAARSQLEQQAQRLAADDARYRQDLAQGQQQAEDERRAAEEARRLAEQRAQQEREALAQERERQQLAQQQLAQQQLAEQQRAQRLAEQQRTEQLAEQQRAQQLAEQQREQQRAEQARMQQLAEQQRAEQQRIEQQRIEQQRSEQQRIEQQRTEQQLAEQRRAEDALRRQAAEQEQARLAQQEAEQVARRQADEGARLAREEQARQRAQAAADGPGTGAGSVAGDGAGRTAGALPRSALGSDLANRARDLVRGIDILKPLPQAMRPAEEAARGLRRALAETVRHDVPLRMYADSVRQKIERNAVLGTAQMAGRDVRTDPVVSVAVRSDGSVEDVTIVRSSGRPDVDELVRRIVRLNARYSAFPPNVAAQYDTIELRRVWSFAGALRLLEEMR
jgi:TonB family protein